MGTFLKNMANAGYTLHSARYSARGVVNVGSQFIGVNIGGLAPSFGPGLRSAGVFEGGVKIDVRVRMPMPSFIRAWQNKERQVLFTSGRYAMRTYRSQLRRPPPQQFTPTGRVSRRYQREVVQGQERPPYRRTGVLYRSVDFTVLLSQGSFIAGPPLITGRGKNVSSAKPVPHLLDTGGPAKVTFVNRRKNTQRVRFVVYRKFPYKDFVFKKTHAFFIKKLREVELRD